MSCSCRKLVRITWFLGVFQTVPAGLHYRTFQDQYHKHATFSSLYSRTRSYSIPVRLSWYVWSLFKRMAELDTLLHSSPWLHRTIQCGFHVAGCSDIITFIWKAAHVTFEDRDPTIADVFDCLWFAKSRSAWSWHQCGQRCWGAKAEDNRSGNNRHCLISSALGWDLASKPSVLSTCVRL